jgi:hypothetical protein
LWESGSLIATCKKGKHAYIKFGISEKFIHSNHSDHYALLFWFGYVGCELREATTTMFLVNLVNPTWDYVVNSPWPWGRIEP